MLGNPSLRIFEGVHFVLFGFDHINEQKVRTKLLAGGGVDVGQYSPDCTHLVVDKITSDNPICVAAQEDGKMVVTALWVDHSADIGMPLEPNSIMYRPLKDLNGIPGTKSLVICLTGYHRQDRDDIMTMVGLMGAEFSKPLVAHRVTHLVCYKFEGDKYELAKKLQSIKLVNHRWLEDCLRDWEILPEAKYNKSGYEMELMEAEAKDSEDEEEETFVKKIGVTNMHKTSYSMKTAVPEAHECPKLVDNVSNVRADLTAPVGSINELNFLDISDIGVDNAFGSKSEQASKVGDTFTPYSMKTVMPEAQNFSEVLEEGLTGNANGSKSKKASKFANSVAQMLAHEDVIPIIDSTSGELPDPNCRTPSGVNVRNDVTTSSGTGEGNLHSVGRLSASGYSRKTSRKLEEISSKGSGSSRMSIGKPKVTDYLCPSSLKVEQEKSNICADFVDDISKLTNSDFGGVLPQKRTLTGSCTTPKSPKICKDSKSCGARSPQTGGKLARLESPIGGLNEADNSRFSLGESKCSRGKNPKLDAPEKHGGCDAFNRSPSPAKLSYKQPFSSVMVSGSGQNLDAVEKKSPFSFRSPISRTSPDAVGGFLVGKSTAVLGDVEQPQNCQQDVAGSVVSNRISNGNTSNDPSKGDLVGNSNSVSKPVRKKTIAKKSLCSKPKLASGSNQKGSICLDEGASRDTAEFCSSKEINVSSTFNKDIDISFPTVNNETHEEVHAKDAAQSGGDTDNKRESVDDETEAPEEKVEEESENALYELKAREPTNKDDNVLSTISSEEGKKRTEHESAAELVESKSRGYGIEKNKNKIIGKTKIKVPGRTETMESSHHKKEETQNAKDEMVKLERKKGTEQEHLDVLAEINLRDSVKKKKSKAKGCVIGKTNNKKVPAVTEIMGSKDNSVGETKNAKDDKAKGEDEKRVTGLLGKSKRISVPKNKLGHTNEAEKENVVVGQLAISGTMKKVEKSTVESNLTPVKNKSKSVKTNLPGPEGMVLNQARNEPVCFILSGHRFQRKEYQKIIRNLKGRFCRDSHQWSYQATHFIAPDPIRRTEKFFAAVASGRWVLKPDYLTASSQAGKFLSEEPYEWYSKGLSEEGAINLEAPRKWRLLREGTGHGALHGMRIIIYGDCIAPPLDTLKRVVKAGGGTVLATSPPYSRFFNSGVDFVIVSPGMPRVDVWVQEFLKHEIPCVVADYLVEYVCKPGYSLEKHVLYNSHAWAEKSFAQLKSRAEEVVMELTPPHTPDANDITCEICGSRDRGEEMLICGNEDGSMGCGIGTHIDCCDPPFEDVPEEDWFCPNCIKSKSSSTAAKKRRKGNSSYRK